MIPGIFEANTKVQDKTKQDKAQTEWMNKNG